MADKIGLAVAGCGSVAVNTYLPGLRRPALARGTELVAVFSRTEARARWAKERFGARAWFTDYDEMLAYSGGDAFVNLTPKPSPPDLGLAALAANKHLYQEKPLAASLVEAAQLIDVARQRNL